LSPGCPPEPFVCVHSNIKCKGGQYDTQAQIARNLEEREREDGEGRKERGREKMEREGKRERGLLTHYGHC